MHFRRRQNEHNMGGWLFDRLKQRVKSRRREHVCFVDDEDLIAIARRRQGHGLDDDFTHIVDAGMRRRIHFQHVQGRRSGNLLAGGAFIAWLGRGPLRTIESFCENTRRRRFTATARAGEFGHTVLYPDGRKCLCGNHGCWEEYASDKALCRLYHEHGGEEICDSLEVIRRAKAGDVAALAATAEVGRNLGLGLMNVITGLNPAAICLDDFAACGWDLIEPAIWDVLRSRVPDYWLAGVRIFPSEHAIHASLSGAVALALSKYFTSFHHGQIA